MMEIINTRNSIGYLHHLPMLVNSIDHLCHPLISIILLSNWTLLIISIILLCMSCSISLIQTLYDLYFLLARLLFASLTYSFNISSGWAISAVTAPLPPSQAFKYNLFVSLLFTYLLIYIIKLRLSQAFSAVTAPLPPSLPPRHSKIYSFHYCWCFCFVLFFFLHNFFWLGAATQAPTPFLVLLETLEYLHLHGFSCQTLLFGHYGGKVF